MAPRNRVESIELTESQIAEVLDKFRATLRLHNSSRNKPAAALPPATELDVPMFAELVKELLLDSGTVRCRERIHNPLQMFIFKHLLDWTLLPIRKNLSSSHYFCWLQRCQGFANGALALNLIDNLHIAL